MFKLLGKNLVSDQERKNALAEMSDNLKRQIVNIEVDLRTLERQKLKGGDLAKIEEIIKGGKLNLDMLNQKLETVIDFQKGN